MSYILYRSQPQRSSRGDGEGNVWCEGFGDGSGNGAGTANGCSKDHYTLEKGWGDGWSPGGGYGNGRGDGDRFWISREKVVSLGWIWKW